MAVATGVCERQVVSMAVATGVCERQVVSVAVATGMCAPGRVRGGCVYSVSNRDGSDHVQLLQPAERIVSERVVR